MSERRLPPHITEDDVRLIAEIITPDIVRAVAGNPQQAGEDRSKLIEIYKAWHVSGPAPDIHRRAQADLRKHWPTLARAIEGIRL